MAVLFGRSWTREALIQRMGSLDQVAGIRPVELTEGTGRGSRLLHVWTGSGLTFDVLVDRGLDIAACRYKGVPLAWHSAVGDVHPAYYDPNGLGFLRAFQGGLLVTCGLDQFGAPSVDEDEALGLHGRIGGLPAQHVQYATEWRDDEYLLVIEGSVRQTRVFGENLVLRRRIYTALGSSRIHIEDQVINEAFTPSPHMILYHFNFGFPLVSEHSTLHIESAETHARDAEAEVGLQHWNALQPPTANYREQVFRHTMQAGANGMTSASLHNPQLDLTVRLSFEAAALPSLFQWKMMGQGTYVLGLEPANCTGIGGRAAARAAGDLPYLQAGERRSYALTLDIIE